MLLYATTIFISAFPLFLVQPVMKDRKSRPPKRFPVQVITGWRDRADGERGWSGVAAGPLLPRVRVIRVRRRAGGSRLAAAGTSQPGVAHR